MELKRSLKINRYPDFQKGTKALEDQNDNIDAIQGSL